jgi:hypothetical protein
MGDRRKRQTYTASPAEPGGLPVMLDEAIAFVGADNAAGRVDFKHLTDWQPLIGGGETRPYLIRLVQRGKPYYYFRVGDNRTPLPGQPGDKDFEKAYAAASAAETKRKAKP